MVNDVDRLSTLQTLKGWFYVIVTAGLLYVLIQRDFKVLQDAQVALTIGYEATLEGWVRALDLRDNATEIHTRRVTELTVLLAKKMGFDHQELEQIRRGALLHDIGKMGIPDRVLQKPGPLTDEEWEIMRKHPIYACEFLSPISYLESALEIPCYHHEKWDGSGYPNGLSGNEIPLSARIFAVVDVWDALLSDRSYRKSWTEAEAADYIKSRAGSQFDPEVVSSFLDIMEES
jgi:putative nucleotidyltransferase with HDIG domain